MKSTSFTVYKVENLNVNFCFVLNWTFPPFCAGARIQEIYSWDGVEEGILTSIFSIKQLAFNHTNFVVYMK